MLYEAHIRRSEATKYLSEVEHYGITNYRTSQIPAPYFPLIFVLEGEIMNTVYIIESLKDSSKHYVGFTRDLVKRLKAHNAKKSQFSKKYAPWEVVCRVSFKDEIKARKFERYLKKGSGFAFLKRHLI